MFIICFLKMLADGMATDKLPHLVAFFKCLVLDAYVWCIELAS
jgi:hypothetical protein